MAPVLVQPDPALAAPDAGSDEDDDLFKQMMGDAGTGTSDAGGGDEDDDLFKQMMGAGDAGAGDAGAASSPDAAVDPDEQLYREMMGDDKKK
jgi:hypothetical protein